MNPTVEETIVTCANLHGDRLDQPLKKIFSDNLRAYAAGRAPPWHIIGVPDAVRGNAINIVLTDGHGQYSQTSLFTHACMTRAALQAGQAPGLYPVLFTPSYSHATRAVSEYRAAWKASQTARHVQDYAI